MRRLSGKTIDVPYVPLRKWGGSKYHAVNPDTMLKLCRALVLDSTPWVHTPGASVTCRLCVALIAGRSDPPRSPERQSWDGMKNRCRNPSHRQYHQYGGRGITVCERWMTFENFLADMSERPVGMTLDRYPNKDGNYEPGNCRWATQRQQVNNTRSNRIICIDGKEKTMSEWGRLYGIGISTIFERLRMGWTAADAVQKPVMRRRH